MTDALATQPTILPMRSPEVVMDLKRLGSMHQTRLSFMRALMRRVMSQQWQFTPVLVELDDQGFGTVIYRIEANENTYSFVAFADYLADEDRNDRVIADKWDVTMALCIGDVSADQLADMRTNVPKQEAGRCRSNTIVLSRGNKSSRNFNYVVDELAAGRQPSMQYLANVGYLYRTTAVYGSGKFGMADWAKVSSQCAEFAHPFAAEMLCCYMLRHFSVQQAEHLARIKSPDTAVPMQDEVKRYLGIGNSTGLGMAPYLIRHPQLISQWVLTRERAIATVVQQGEVNPASVHKFQAIMAKAAQHFAETTVPDPVQVARNKCLQKELVEIQSWIKKWNCDAASWSQLTQHLAENCSLETQELINSVLLEVFPDLVDACEQYGCVDENHQLSAEMSRAELKQLIETRYGWALDIDFSNHDCNHYFWYRSEEKMEPRLGERFAEPGADKEMPLTIARLVRQCYDCLLADMEELDEAEPVAYFLLRHPGMASIVKRIQTMSQECYGDIRANLADKEMLPLDLLRCKLSFFGVSKFDPKSKLWVRNTMFQGAPILSDIGKPFADDWYFPVAGEPGAT
ncbi:MAG: hypothetical protein KJP04_00230 [Arenicella sp.]|nr:hypothetical protein [Arenicella sp.]